ncbi:hypothetical protein D3C73_1468570 [compost metagenome]
MGYSFQFIPTQSLSSQDSGTLHSCIQPTAVSKTTLDRDVHDLRQILERNGYFSTEHVFLGVPTDVTSTTSNGNVVHDTQLLLHPAFLEDLTDVRRGICRTTSRQG